MALQVSQSIPTTGVAVVPLTPSASETIASGSFGPVGVAMRVITTGTATTVTVNDPNLTTQGNPGTPAGVVCSATGARMILVPRSAISSATDVATSLFSGALTGVTYELYRY